MCRTIVNFSRSSAAGTTDLNTAVRYLMEDETQGWVRSAQSSGRVALFMLQAYLNMKLEYSVRSVLEENPRAVCSILSWYRPRRQVGVLTALTLISVCQITL